MTVPENDMPSVVPALFEDQPTTAITNLDEIETNKQLNEEDKSNLPFKFDLDFKFNLSILNL